MTYTQLVAAGVMGMGLPFDRTHRYRHPADSGSFPNGRRRGMGTDADGRGKQKRIAKRRAKKGYR